MRKMKDSGVEWIPYIPSEWNVVKGKHILLLQKRPPLENQKVITCFRDGEVTLRANRRSDGFTFADKEIGYQGIQKGDLVIHGMDGFAGAIGVSDSNGKGSPVLIVCKTNQISRFLVYYLRMLADQKVFLALAKGIRERSCDLRWGTIADLPFMLPEQTEQIAIANHLDSKCSQIDSIIEKTQQEIEKLKEYRQSLITEAVTKGLDPDAEMKDSNICYFGKIPENWKTSTIKHVCEKYSDGSHFSPVTVDNGMPYITAKDVQGVGLNYSEAKKISYEDYEQLQKAGCGLKKGYVLLVKDGAGAGRTGLVVEDTPCVALSSVAFFDTNSNFVNRYLMYALSSTALQEQIKAAVAGSAITRITLAKIATFLVPFPPRDVQYDIANYLDVKTGEIERVIKEKGNLIDKLQQYKKSLIYECVTGKREVPADA